MKVTYQLQELKIDKLEGTSRITIGSTLHDAMDEDDEEELECNEEGIKD